MAQAVEANLFAFFQHLADWPRVEFHDDQECCWTLSDLPFPLFNSVMRARLPLDRADAMIDARIAACRSRNVPMLWWTGPSTMPADLGARLERHGFVLEGARTAWPPICTRRRARGAAGRSRRSSIEPVEDAVDACDLEPRALRFVRRAATVWRRFAELAVDDWARRAIAVPPFSRARRTASRRRPARCFSAPASPASTTCRPLPERRSRGIGRAVTRAAMQRGARPWLSHGDPALVGARRRHVSRAWLPGRLPDRPARLGAARIHAMTLQDEFGNIDIYVFDQLLRGRIAPGHARVRCRLRRRPQSRLSAAPGLRRLRQ